MAKRNPRGNRNRKAAQTGNRRRGKPRVRSRATKGRATRAPARRASTKIAAKKKRVAASKASPKKKTVARRKPVRSAASVASTKSRTPRRSPPRLDRARRTLTEVDVFQTPPSSLDMDRKGTAARTGRAEIAENLQKHGTSMEEVAGGDVDVNIETAYFSGDEAPGGDNPTPDQDIVDDIGKALGVEYQDQEELKSSDKIIERDKHRWELDPASSEDYKDRK